MERKVRKKLLSTTLRGNEHMSPDRILNLRFNQLDAIKGCARSSSGLALLALAGPPSNSAMNSYTGEEIFINLWHPLHLLQFVKWTTE